MGEPDKYKGLLFETGRGFLFSWIYRGIRCSAFQRKHSHVSSMISFLNIELTHPTIFTPFSIVSIFHYFLLQFCIFLWSLRELSVMFCSQDGSSETGQKAAKLSKDITKKERGIWAHKAGLLCRTETTKMQRSWWPCPIMSCCLTYFYRRDQSYLSTRHFIDCPDQLHSSCQLHWMWNRLKTFRGCCPPWSSPWPWSKAVMVLVWIWAPPSTLSMPKGYLLWVF